MILPATASKVRGRFAPSPTGFLHLGNAWAFLCAWLGARAAGGELVLRLEDIDPQRSKPEFEQAMREDLLWLGLDWDYGPGSARGDTLPPGLAPFRQSANSACYAAGLADLQDKGLVYPCFCTRKELRSLAGAPQAGDGADAEGAYPGTCAVLSAREAKARVKAGDHYALRLRFAAMRDKYLHFNDLCLGRQTLAPQAAGGDFALRRSDGVYAYQLAVVLDDIRMGVTQVVRGRDILTSTPRQLFLYDCFGAVPPSHAHVPLMLDHEGERLAKRHASLSLRGLRASGVPPEAVVGYLAWWGGLRDAFAPCHASELVPDFSFTRIKKSVDLLPPSLPELLLKAPA